MAEGKSGKIGFDEAYDLISEIARNGEGPDQFRALKVIMAQETTSAILPDPLTDAEVLERLARLIRAVGPTGSQLAYRIAFPKAQRSITHAGVKVTEADVPPIDTATLPRDLRALYKMFPEIKRGGFPKGFPVNSGLAVRAEWCQKTARKMLLDREQRRVDIIATEAAEEVVDAT